MFFRQTQHITGVVKTHITVHVNGRCCFEAKIVPRALCTHHMIQGSAWLVDPQPSSKILALAFWIVGAQAEKFIPCTSDRREYAVDSQFRGYLLQAIRHNNSQEHADRLLHSFNPDIWEMVMAIHFVNSPTNLMLKQPPGLLSGVARVRHDHTMFTQFCNINAIG